MLVIQETEDMIYTCDRGEKFERLWTKHSSIIIQYIYIFEKIVLNIFFEEIGLSLSRGVTVAPNASKWPG
jgi:hypothetical protein